MGGHTHQDSFQVMRSSRQGELAAISLEHPSMTSNYNCFPSYRVYDMDRDTYALIDYEQYRLNLTIVNANNDPKWHVAYRFKDYYNVSRMDERAFMQIAQKIRVFVKCKLV